MAGLVACMDDPKNVEEIWAGLQLKLRRSLGDGAYNDWIAQLSPLENPDHSSDHVLYLGAPSGFVKDWISTHYLEMMESFLTHKNSPVGKIVIAVAPSPFPPRNSPGFFDNNVQGESSSPGIPREGSSGSYQGYSGSFSSKESFKNDTASQKNSEELLFQESNHPPLFQEEDLDPRFTFDDFVVGGSNEFAYAAARRVAESSDVIYNPLFLYGPVGHGKTHLMHAIARHVYHADRKNNVKPRTICYLSAEKFMYHFIRAIRYRDTVSFKERFRSVDILMIDDVQFISGKDSTQEELFHTFNSLVEQKKQVIFSADKSPSDLAGIQERMRSRLGWGLVADLHPTTYELRMGILESKVAKLSVDFSLDILSFLAQKISSNIRELEGALTRLAAHASFVGRPVTFDLTQEVLRDLLRVQNQEVSIDTIQKKVAEYYGIRLSDMHSSKRSRNIVRPRQIAMFLSKHMTTTSLPEIGRKFGGRDHTTVLHAIQLVDQLMEKDLKIKEDVALLQRTLKS